MKRAPRKDVCSRPALGDTMKTAKNYAGDLDQFLRRYRYQSRLTKELDSRTGDLDQLAVNEIVLWKVNRYAPLSPDTLAKINALAKTKTGAHRGAEDCLKALLGEAGVDLPMASSLLRFRNPLAFQVIDRTQDEGEARCATDL